MTEEAAPWEREPIPLSRLYYRVEGLESRTATGHHCTKHDTIDRALGAADALLQQHDIDYVRIFKCDTESLPPPSLASSV